MVIFNNNRRKKILFISSPITTKLEKAETLDYFAYIISKLSQTISIDNGYKEYDLVVRVPEDGANPLIKQRNLITEAEEILKKNKKEYVAVIISPYNKNELIQEISSLCKETKVLLIDQGYYTKEEKKYFYDKKIDRPPFVQSNWEQAGKIAAKSMVDFFINKKIKKPNIVIVKGLVGSVERINGFKKYFKGTEIEPNYLEEIDGKYSREKASEVFLVVLRESKNLKKRIDAIYATNDAMALGVKEILNNNRHLLSRRYPIVVGNDGIRDFTLSMQLKDQFLHATVNVQVIEQVELLVKNILSKYLSGEKMEVDEKYRLHPSLIIKK